PGRRHRYSAPARVLGGHPNSAVLGRSSPKGEPWICKANGRLSSPTGLVGEAMKWVVPALLWATYLCPTIFAFGEMQAPSPDKTANDVITEARQARNQADVKGLASLIEQIRKRSSPGNAFEEYVQIALLEDWLYEAALIHKDTKLARQAA